MTLLATKMAPIETESRSDESADDSSIDKLARLYNFPPLPPHLPSFEDSEVPMPAREYNSGIMMAGRLIASLCPPAKSHEGQHPPLLKERKPVPELPDAVSTYSIILTLFSYSSMLIRLYSPILSIFPTR